MKAHDAGFDAYMTAFIFARLAKVIEIGHLVKSVKSAKASSIKE